MGATGMLSAPAAAPAAPAPPAAPASFPSAGPVDISSLTRVAKDDLGLKDQPASPKFKICLAQIYIKDKPYGGADKSSNGHRYDSIPFANGMISAGMSCQLVHYLHTEHDAFFEVMKKFDAIIVRCNPGQIGDDGGSQQKFDDSMREMRKLGIQVWPSPDVMEKMGAKDALCKVAKLNIGLEDTLAYYDEAEFAAGFKKTMKFQPRVIKQNRGSAGEGIWIIKLKSGEYCSSFGEASCADDEVLDMMVARQQVVSSWINVSAHVSSKESFVTTRSVMVLLALSTRSLQRVASQLSVALVPSTLTTDQTSPNLRL